MPVYQIFPDNKKRNLLQNMNVTTKLIITNVVALIVFSILIATGVLSMSEIALTPSRFFAGKDLWTLLTSMFMHAGIAHIVFNMISLFFVGILLEKLIGKKRFFWFYIVAGLFAGFFYAVLANYLGVNATLATVKPFSLEWLRLGLFGNPQIGAIGASGAIFGLVGVLAVLIPRKKISLVAGPLIAIILESFLMDVFPNSSFVAGLSFIFTIYIFFSIFAMFSFNSSMYKLSLPLAMPFWVIPIAAIVPLVIFGFFVPLPIANSAHFGGLIIGLVYGFYLKKKYPRKTEYLSRNFI